MTNNVDASLKCSFKGELHELSANLDLDQLMRQYGRLPSLHQILARQNDIDTYSYLYEVIEITTIQFRNATGLAGDFTQDQKLDSAGFEKAWKQAQMLSRLEEISKQEMKIDNLDQHPELSRALQRAYELGMAADNTDREN